MVHEFLQWLMGVLQWFVGFRISHLVRGFAQWFVGLRNGSWVRNDIGGMYIRLAQAWFGVYVMVRGFT